MPGQVFTIGVSECRQRQRVTLVKTGSVTHSVNMDQRFIELPFTANGDLLDVQLPARASDTPPGYYLMFVLNRAGRAVDREDGAHQHRLRRRSRPSDYTPTIGGGGGAPFMLACAADEVLVGVHGTHGDLRQSGRPAVRARRPVRPLDRHSGRRAASRARGHRHGYTRRSARATPPVSGFRGRFRAVRRISSTSSAGR